MTKSSAIPLVGGAMVIYAAVTFFMIFFSTPESQTNATSQLIFLFFDPLPKITALLGVSIPGVAIIWPTVFISLGALALLFYFAEKH